MADVSNKRNAETNSLDAASKEKKWNIIEGKDKGQVTKNDRLRKSRPKVFQCFHLRTEIKCNLVQWNNLSSLDEKTKIELRQVFLRSRHIHLKNQYQVEELTLRFGIACAFIASVVIFFIPFSLTSLGFEDLPPSAFVSDLQIDIFSTLISFDEKAFEHSFNSMLHKFFGINQKIELGKFLDAMRPTIHKLTYVFTVIVTPFLVWSLSYVASFVFFISTPWLSGRLLGLKNPDHQNLLSLAATVPTLLLLGLFGIWALTGIPTSADPLYLKLAFLFFFGLIVQFPLLIIITIFTSALSNMFFIHQRMNRKYPDHYISNMIFVAILQLEKQEEWFKLKSRKNIIRSINEASNTIHEHLVRLFRPKSRRDQLEWRQRTRRIAMSLSEKEAWLITPQEHTRTDVLAYLSKFLKNFLKGEWHYLPEGHELTPEQRSAQQATRRANRVHASLQVARLLASGLIPTAILFGSKYAGLDVPAPIDGYVSVAVLLWLAVTMVSALDPLSTGKVSLLKELITMMPGFGKSAGRDKSD